MSKYAIMKLLLWAYSQLFRRLIRMRMISSLGTYHRQLKNLIDMYVQLLDPGQTLTIFI